MTKLHTDLNDDDRVGKSEFLYSVMRERHENKEVDKGDE